jgi:hypothetical protein
LDNSVLALLIITVIFGTFSVWSAFNPSYFTIKKFTENENDWKLITTGIVLAIAVMIMVTVASFVIVEAL